jgi:hypothetical protein
MAIAVRPYQVLWMDRRNVQISRLVNAPVLLTSRMRKKYASEQGLTLVHFSSSREHFLWATLGQLSTFGNKYGSRCADGRVEGPASELGWLLLLHASTKSRNAWKSISLAVSARRRLGPDRYCSPRHRMYDTVRESTETLSNK